MQEEMRKNQQPITSRVQVTEKILVEKMRRKISWAMVGELLNSSREWATAACLGQMQLSKHDAEIIARTFGLTDEECAWLQIVPYKGHNDHPSSDPLLYRFYEILGVYGPTLKELIHEDFGDGIMSAVDLNIKLESPPTKDRVVLMLSGKFLPYKKF